jgi:hypothetical protein
MNEQLFYLKVAEHRNSTVYLPFLLQTTSILTSEILVMGLRIIILYI